MYRLILKVIHIAKIKGVLELVFGAAITSAIDGFPVVGRDVNVWRQQQELIHRCRTRSWFLCR
jgi:hypothetical protein